MKTFEMKTIWKTIYITWEEKKEKKKRIDLKTDSHRIVVDVQEKKCNFCHS